MKRSLGMTRFYLSAFLIFLLIFAWTMTSFAQNTYKTTYPKARIFMKNGQMVQGESLIMV